MGGIGKTQIALEYCHQAYSRKANSFHDVFWFNAASEEPLTTGFINLSDIFAPPHRRFRDDCERVDFVIKNLKSWKHPYLMVLDNFDDPAFERVLDYLPSVGPCAVLFTSRLREAGQEFGDMIDVPLMNDTDALETLLSRLRLTNLPEAQYDDAVKVLQLLGNLPLALEQAGAYMSAGGSRMSFRTFVEHYQQRKKIVMSTTPSFWKYKNLRDGVSQSGSLSIFTTWKLSLERLGRDDEDHAKKSHFLALLAFLGSARTSKVLFKSHFKYRRFCPTCSVPSKEWISIFHHLTPIKTRNSTISATGTLSSR